MQKPDNTELAAIDLWMGFKKSDGSIDVPDDRRITQARFACRIVVFTIGAVAMIKIGCDRRVTELRQHMRRIFDEIIQARLSMNHDDTRNRRAALRRAQIKRHVAAVDLCVLP